MALPPSDYNDHNDIVSGGGENREAESPLYPHHHHHHYSPYYISSTTNVSSSSHDDDDDDDSRVVIPGSVPSDYIAPYGTPSDEMTTMNKSNYMGNSNVTVEEDEDESATSTGLLKDGSEKMKRISLFRLAMATICFAGIQFGWALQISLLTPFILELGLPKLLVSIVWLCGPVAGLVVQPIIGAVSDQCTSSFGRRRPFILSGALLVIVSLLLIPNSLDIGSWFGDVSNKHPIALALTVCGFWLLDIANNMLQGPCRAMVADIASPEQQETGNAIFSFWLGIGNITGFIAGWMPWSTWIRFTATKACKVACQDLRISFTLSIIFLIVTVVISLIAANEKPLKKWAVARGNSDVIEVENGDEPRPKSNPVVHLFQVLMKLPKPMKRVCLVQFFNWFAWFTFLIYITVWMAENVFKGSPNEGDPSYHLFAEGVRYGSFGMAGFAGCSLLVSPFVPMLSRVLGPRTVFFIGQVILTICLGSTVVVSNKYLAIALITLVGIPWSITNTIPFALTANVAPKDEKGVYMGILNIFVVVPQLVMSGVGPLISHIFKGNVAAALGAGSIAALISSLCVFMLIIPPNQRTEEKKTKRRKNTHRRTVSSSTTPSQYNSIVLTH